jgi:hypothetical protein
MVAVQLAALGGDWSPGFRVPGWGIEAQGGRGSEKAIGENEVSPRGPVGLAIVAITVVVSIRMAWNARAASMHHVP